MDSTGSVNRMLVPNARAGNNGCCPRDMCARCKV
jgi:hypothetical protein